MLPAVVAVFVGFVVAIGVKSSSRLDWAFPCFD